MKKSLLSLLLCLSLCCSGCSATQVKDRLYLQSLELSNYRYPTVQLHAFQSEEADCSGSGSTLSAALESAEIPAGKSLFLGHLELLGLQAALYDSLTCRSQHGNAAGKPETGRTKRTHSRNRLALDSKGTLQFLRNGSVALSDYQRLFHGADRLERNNTNALQRCHSRTVLAAWQQLSRTGQLIDRRSSKRLSHYQCFDQIHRHHRKWHSHCNRFHFHSWNRKCHCSARTARNCL